jgi:hypothetical protein
MPSDADHSHARARWSLSQAMPRLDDVILSSTLLAASTLLLASDPLCTPCVSTTASPTTVAAPPPEAGFPEPDPIAPPVYEPVPPPPAPIEPPEAPKWERSGYGLFGVAPMAVMRSDSFSPGLRFDFETGFAFTRKRVRFSVGPELHVVQYFGRKKPALGLDAMFTGSWGPVYLRAGLGVMSGLAGTRNLNDMRPGVGGVVGIGLQTLRDHVGGRVGVDYDFRMDTAGRPVQTVLISLRIFFG